MRRQDTISEPGMGSEHSNPMGDYNDTVDDAVDDAVDDEVDDAGDADEDGEEERDDRRSLRLVCAYCGEGNRARPPRGFLFAEEEDGDAEPRQIRYRCGACGEINRREVALARESEAVRVFREAYARRRPWADA